MQVCVCVRETEREIKRYELAWVAGGSQSATHAQAERTADWELGMRTGLCSAKVVLVTYNMWQAVRQRERENRRERERPIRHAHFALHFQRVPCCCQAPLRSLVIRNRIIILWQLYGNYIIYTD